MACKSVKHIPAGCLNHTAVNHSLEVNHSVTDYLRFVVKPRSNPDPFHRSDLKRLLVEFAFGARHKLRFSKDCKSTDLIVFSAILLTKAPPELLPTRGSSCDPSRLMVPSRLQLKLLRHNSAGLYAGKAEGRRK